MSELRDKLLQPEAAATTNDAVVIALQQATAMRSSLEALRMGIEAQIQQANALMLQLQGQLAKPKPEVDPTNVATMGQRDDGD